MAGETLLVVDDNATNQKLLRVMLNAEGYVVYTATTAEEAIALLRTLRPAVILLDLQLPGMDGFAFARRMKRDPAYAAIPIVAITSYAMQGDREKALDAGCDEYVKKPIDTRALPRLVRAMVQRSSTSTANPGA